MKKLLHERLREYGSNCRADYTDWLSQRHANELAAEIEKYYIPRPRFEDGEPVQFGKEFVDCNGHNQTLSSLTYTKGGHGYVSLNGWTKQRIDGSIKRPELDSLEKLRDDIRNYCSDEIVTDGEVSNEMDDWARRLTAIMERDA